MVVLVVLNLQSNVLLGAVCMFVDERSVYIKEIQMYNNKVFMRWRSMFKSKPLCARHLQAWATTRCPPRAWWRRFRTAPTVYPREDKQV